MQKALLISLIFFFSQALYAQHKIGGETANSKPQKTSAPGSEELPTIFINENVTTHFIFSEPITFVDISNNAIAGDQPTSNVLRIKPVNIEEIQQAELDTAQDPFAGVVTIIGQKYMVQYSLKYSTAEKADKHITIQSSEGIALMDPEITMSAPEMKSFCLDVLKKRSTYFSVKSTSSRVSAKLNNIFTIGDYFFVDITFKNHTNIKYDIDQIRFKIEDKAKTKRTNFQQVEIQQEFALYNRPDFKKSYRNVFVFKKFTFPNEKVFTIELAEEQISGRTLILEINYSDVLNADTI